MNKTSFLSFALDVGQKTAQDIACSYGITQAQINLWLASMPTFRNMHHYGFPSIH